VGGLIRECKLHKSKKGDPMAFLTLEDTATGVEVVVFPTAYAMSAPLLNSTDPIVVQGTLKKEERGAKIIAEEVVSLPEARAKYTTGLKVVLQAERTSRKQLEELKKAMREFHGPCPVSLTVHFNGRGEVDVDTHGDLTIRPCRELTTALEKCLGYPGVVYLKKQTELEQRGGKGGRWGAKGERAS
jgi:DNA polymerase-3 subunit alpha